MLVEEIMYNVFDETDQNMSGVWCVSLVLVVH